MSKKKIVILGIRGIPAKHGGFETFAEYFAIYLQLKGWQVTVYCQESSKGGIYEDNWHGITRVHIPVSQNNAKGTIVFDWKSTLHAAKRKISVLTLGYNTAVFCAFYRLKGVKNVINMDGIEWRRGKWNPLERGWLHINEKIGAWLGNHLIADHPEIKNHLCRFVASSKITVIPYGADILKTGNETLLTPFNLRKNKYAILIARPEKENSILEIVKAYSREKRGMPLIILGDYTPSRNAYHKSVINAAGDEVKFIGAIYEKNIVQTIRFFSRFYIHGHTVGGTNPSLVEALGAGSPVLAHDNKFNRWVAGKGAIYFSSEEECACKIEILLRDDDLISKMKKYSLQQIKNNFTWSTVFQAYEQILSEKLF